MLISESNEGSLGRPWWCFGVLGLTLCGIVAACGGANETGEPASMERLRAELAGDTADTGEPFGDGPPAAQGGASIPTPGRLGPGQIQRAQLEATLAEGPGRFLQGMVTEPHRVDGRFVGFRLMSFFPGDPRFAGVDLRRGDVIQRVNGTFIERPEQLVEVWEALGSAEELVIDYSRDGASRTLSFSIVD